MTHESGIYCIRNTVDNKRYIGRTVDFYKRWAMHRWGLENNRHFNSHLQRAYNNNPQNFIFEIIEVCDKDKCNEREIYWISYYNTMNMEYGYNLCEGGKSTTGRKFSEETLKKMSKQRRGVKCSREAVEKRKQSLKDHKERDPEWAKALHDKQVENIRSIPNWKKSHPMSEKRKKEVSEFFKGRKIPEWHKEKLRDLYSGENSLTAKLTENEVVNMRLRFLKGEPRMSIAKDYPNMHPNTIYDIVKGKRWKHIPNTIEELEKLL